VTTDWKQYMNQTHANTHADSARAHGGNAVDATGSRPIVLIVEDDPQLCNALLETLRIADLPCEGCDSGDEAVARVLRGGVGLVVTDVNLRGLDGFGVLHELTSRPDMPPVVMMTAYGTIDRAVRAMKGGAVDYLTKPFRPHELLQCVARHIRPAQVDDPVAADPRSLAVLQQARRIAAADASVLITGESGTGKEVYARFIHRHSTRADKPFITINCATLPENLLESILFGYDKGLFTGATQARTGKFQQADGGTLLLDEVTEMPPELQAKLLRVLQEREVEPLGAKAPTPIDVRIIATSNRNMRAAVANRTFREDLYFRLNVLPLELPALRERPADILPLAQAILHRHCRQQNRSVTLAPSAQAALLAHSWPGNVRELDNALLRTLVLHAGDEMHGLDLGLQGGDAHAMEGGGALPRTLADVAASRAPMLPTAGLPARLGEERRRSEDELILEALQRHDGHRGRTASELGIAERTLRHRLKQMRERNPRPDAPATPAGEASASPMALGVE
jgi:two-component system response regulator FlrC